MHGTVFQTLCPYSTGLSLIDHLDLNSKLDPEPGRTRLARCRNICGFDHLTSAGFSEEDILFRRPESYPANGPPTAPHRSTAV